MTHAIAVLLWIVLFGPYQGRPVDIRRVEGRTTAGSYYVQVQEGLSSSDSSIYAVTVRDVENIGTRPTTGRALILHEHSEGADTWQLQQNNAVYTITRRIDCEDGPNRDLNICRKPSP